MDKIKETFHVVIRKSGATEFICNTCLNARGADILHVNLTNVHIPDPDPSKECDDCETSIDLLIYLRDKKAGKYDNGFTVEHLNNWIKATNDEAKESNPHAFKSGYFVRNKFKCKHGGLSLQASIHHYSIPKNTAGPHTNYEAWYFSWELDKAPHPKHILHEYYDWDGDQEHSNPATYVPTETIVELINALGGPTDKTAKLCRYKGQK